MLNILHSSNVVVSRDHIITLCLQHGVRAITLESRPLIFQFGFNQSFNDLKNTIKQSYQSIHIIKHHLFYCTTQKVFNVYYEIKYSKTNLFTPKETFGSKTELLQQLNLQRSSGRMTKKKKKKKGR